MSKIKALRRSLRDAADTARRARSAGELAKALVPQSMLQQHVLNPAADSDAAGAATAGDDAAALRAVCNRLRADNIRDDGSVDYRSLRGGGALAELESAASALHRVTPQALPRDADRIAFWLNVYNVLGIHGVIALGIEGSVMERPSFFSTVAYRVGDSTFTLDEIENGVLRLNSPHPATRRRLFSSKDPRLAYCPRALDPRIHSALVCCSASCPPVAFCTADRLEQQLDAATRNYVANDVSVDHPGRVIRLPITFDYYRNDWNDAATMQAFLLSHADDPLRTDLKRAFDADYPLEFQRYDWSLNGSG